MDIRWLSNFWVRHMGLIQKIINLVLSHIRFYVNGGGEVIILSKPRYLTHIAVRNKDAKLFIGKNTCIGTGTRIGTTKEVHIGNNVMVSSFCVINDTQHNYKYRKEDRMKEKLIGNKCVIKDGAWIGFGSVVISSTIGKNSVVGANSTVIDMTVPKDTIFVGDSRLNYKMKKIKYI